MLTSPSSPITSLPSSRSASVTNFFPQNTPPSPSREPSPFAVVEKENDQASEAYHTITFKLKMPVLPQKNWNKVSVTLMRASDGHCLARWLNIPTSDASFQHAGLKIQGRKGETLCCIELLQGPYVFQFISRAIPHFPSTPTSSLDVTLRAGSARTQADITLSAFDSFI